MFILISINFNTVFPQGEPSQPTLPPLDINKYTQLKTISEKNIATIDQLRACQKVFEVLDKRGYSSEFDIISTSLIKILENTNPSVDQVLVFAPLWVACKTRAEEIDIATSDFAPLLTKLIIDGVRANMSHTEIAIPLIEKLHPGF